MTLDHFQNTNTHAYTHKCVCVCVCVCVYISPNSLARWARKLSSILSPPQGRGNLQEDRWNLGAIIVIYVQSTRIQERHQNHFTLTTYE